MQLLLRDHLFCCCAGSAACAAPFSPYSPYSPAQSRSLRSLHQRPLLLPPAAFGTRTRTYADGSALADEVSRRPDDELFIDETCEDEYLPEGRADCVMPRIARRPPRVMPRCWNWNESVVADQPCRAPADGSPVELCLEVGITQSAYVVECGGKAMTDPHCGTFLEIHRPGRADKLSETRLRGSYPSGYRMTIISTTYKRHSSRVICYDPIKQGNYEAWWVQRTFYNFIVERRIPFRVISPECDWDPQNNRFLPYATLGVARQLSGLDPKDPDRVLFSRKRVEGRPGFPGKGMGSTLVLPANDTWHSTAQFDAAAWHDFSTYTFTPEKPDYTVKSGRIEPSFAEQAAWALLQAERGYRRQLGEEEAGQGSGPGPGPSEEERG